jgi:5'-nucleotidase
VVAAVLAAALLAGCSSSDGDASSAGSDAEASATTAAPPPLRILLSNDDGITNPAIDVLLGLLSQEPGVEVTVVAPAENKSGSSDTMTPGGATFQAGTTPAGVQGYAVNGFPADSVVVGLDHLGLEPHLVVSGINPGQNIGPFAKLSGTVGVGRTAIRRGIPALAVSGAIDFDQAQFTFGAQLAMDWIRAHRTELVEGTAQTETVTSFNIPACPVAQMGTLQTLPLATAVPEGMNPFESSCDKSDPAPADDVIAIAVGYPVVTQVPADL